MDNHDPRGQKHRTKGGGGRIIVAWILLLLHSSVFFIDLIEKHAFSEAFRNLWEWRVRGTGHAIGLILMRATGYNIIAIAALLLSLSAPNEKRRITVWAAVVIIILGTSLVLAQAFINY